MEASGIIKKTNVHGYTVLYDPKFDKGIYYLQYDLQYNEALVFFKHAQMYGKAEFEDDQDRNWTLIKNPDGTFTLTQRKEYSGWF